MEFVAGAVVKIDQLSAILLRLQAYLRRHSTSHLCFHFVGHFCHEFIDEGSPLVEPSHNAPHELKQLDLRVIVDGSPVEIYRTMVA